MGGEGRPPGQQRCQRREKLRPAPKGLTGHGEAVSDSAAAWLLATGCAATILIGGVSARSESF